MSFLSILALYAASFVMELPLGIRFTQPWYRYAWGILYANGKSGMLKANAPLWFLPCMFCVLLMLYGVAHLAKGKKLVYAALTALSAAIGLLNERFRVIDRWPLGFETALHMLPFALMGYAFRSVSEKIETMPDARKAVAGIALLAAGTAVQMGFDVSGLYMFDRYSSLALLYVCALAISVGVALLGMVRALPHLRQICARASARGCWPVRFRWLSRLRRSHSRCALRRKNRSRESVRRYSAGAENRPSESRKLSLSIS